MPKANFDELQNVMKKIDKQSDNFLNILEKDGDINKVIPKTEIEKLKFERKFILDVVRGDCTENNIKKFKKYHKMGATYLELVKDYHEFLRALLDRFGQMGHEIRHDAILSKILEAGDTSPEKQIDMLEEKESQYKTTIDSYEKATLDYIEEISHKESEIEKLNKKVNALSHPSRPPKMINRKLAKFDFLEEDGTEYRLHLTSEAIRDIDVIDGHVDYYDQFRQIVFLDDFKFAVTEFPEGDEAPIYEEHIHIYQREIKSAIEEGLLKIVTNIEKIKVSTMVKEANFMGIKQDKMIDFVSWLIPHKNEILTFKTMHDNAPISHGSIKKYMNELERIGWVSHNNSIYQWIHHSQNEVLFE